MKLRLLSCLTLLTLLGMSLHAETIPMVGLETGSSWYLSFPKYEDAIPYRSSVTADASLDFTLEEDGCFSYGLLIPFSYVSASPTFAGSSRRAFLSVGGGLRFAYRFENNIGVFLSGSLTYNRYFIDQEFLSFWIKSGPEWTFAGTSHWKFSLAMPVCVNLRKDITGLAIGISARIDYLLVPREKEKNR